MKENNLTGLDRAAVIFKFFGNSLAVSLFKTLSASEMGRVRNHAATIKHVPFDVKKKILEDYYFELMGQKFKESSGESVEELFDFIHDLSNEQIVYLLIPETAVAIALALSQMEVNRQAEIISGFDLDVQSDVLMEMNEINNMPYEGVINIEKDLKEKSKMIPKKAKFNKGGSKQIAELLSKMDPNFGKQFVDQLQSEDPNLAKDLSRYHVQFEDITKLPVQILRDVISSVEMMDLAMALKGMDEEFRNAISTNMAQKAQIMLESEIEDLEGPQSRKKVEAARKKILEIISGKIHNGTLNLEDLFDEDMIE